jgi:Ca-activated chloride channel family protein
MRGLAERGAGNFYFIEDASAATEVFTEEMDVFMSPIALDLQIEATTGPGWQMREVVGTKLWQAGANRGSMAVPAVFFASRTSQQGEVGRRGGGSMIFVRLDPTAAGAGKVSDLKLTYRLPNTQEIITHTVALDYTANPNDELPEPHLSYPEMAERYAMYNLFLGFRVATTEAAVGDYNCAVSALAATRNNAELWNSTHGNDPDIAADIALADLFIQNLRQQGATGETSLSSCPTATDPYPDYNEGYGEDYQPMACSSSKANAGWLLILGALGLVIRRRTRR